MSAWLLLLLLLRLGSNSAKCTRMMNYEKKRMKNAFELGEGKQNNS